MLENFFTFLYNKNTCGYGGMADALGSGPSGGNSMEVQVLLTAPEKRLIAAGIPPLADGVPENS